MLKTRIVHPDILAALASAGHGSRVLLADGNYPFATRRGPRATLVHLNVAPGLVGLPQLLEPLLATIPVEAAAVMQPAQSGPHAMPGDPPIWADFRRLLDEAGCERLELERLERFEFYDAASGPDVALTIATGERQIYANLLLTIGVA